MKLSAKFDPRIISRTEKKWEKYLNHDTQNEIIRLMVFVILRDIAKNINDSMFYSKDKAIGRIMWGLHSNKVHDHAMKGICMIRICKDSILAILRTYLQGFLRAWGIFSKLEKHQHCYYS